jgi:hypothetical protein
MALLFMGAFYGTFALAWAGKMTVPSNNFVAIVTNKECGQAVHPAQRTQTRNQ